MAAAAGRTVVAAAEPVHHVTGVSAVTTAQAEVGGAADGHVTDGALEGEALTDGALSPTGLTATVTAVHPELCRGGGGARLLWQHVFPKTNRLHGSDSEQLLQTPDQSYNYDFFKVKYNK